jgi:hypothetical protein
MSTQLTVQQRAAVALQSDKARAELTALAASSQSIKAPTNPAGRAECHAAAMAAAGARIAIVKAGKDARDDATQFSKAVIAEEARLVAIIQPEETRLKALRDAYDADQARIKAEKAEAERLRVLEISGRIARIKQAASDAARFDVSAAAASEILSTIRAIEIDATFAEFYGEAAETRAAAIAEIAKVIESKRQAEVAAAKAEADRIELEKVRKAEAEAARIKAQQEAAARAEQAKVEAAVLKAEHEKIDAARKEIAEREAKFAADRAAALAEIDARRRAQEYKERAAHESRIAEEAKAEAAKAEAARVELERIATARRQIEADDRRRIAAINDRRAAVSAMLDAVEDEDVIEEIFDAVHSIVERAAERFAA